MTTDEYNTTIERLGCRSAREAADLIGCCERMAGYYKAGNPVPLVVAKSLRREIELRRLRNVVERLRGKWWPGQSAAAKLIGEQF